jgi:hypothetical protein
MKQKNNENKVPHGFTSLGELENEFQRTLLEKMPIQPTEPGNFFTALFKQFFSKVEPKKIFAVITIDNDIFQDFLDVTNGHSGLTPKLLIAPPTLPYDYDFIILDLDSFREIETAIDYLLGFRKTWPSVPVILATLNRRFKHDSSGKLHICDAVIEKPITRQGFSEALTEAESNNFIWLQRF